jgi:acyl-CoA synthetase (AMP-forming)/AMP-acid ligase II
MVIVPGDVDSPAAAAAGALHIPVLKMRSPGTLIRTTLDSRESASPVRSTEAALLLFTSATTGNPKLVPLTRVNLHDLAAREIKALPLSATDRFLSLMPLFHMQGLSAALAQLLCGGTVIGTLGFNPTTFLDWLDQFQPTWFTSSPPLNRSILGMARQRPEVFRRAPLRFIRTAGASPQPEVVTSLEECMGVPVLNGYGLTETGGVTRNTAEARKVGAVGRASGLDIGIMDAAGNLVADGQEGEIAVRGASVTSGYLDDPEANQASFRDGWFRTGDIGRLDSENFLFITGRLKEMIDRGGEKILPQGVEDVLAAHPAVADAAVFAVAHPTLGEDIVAAVVLREGAVATALELRRFAAVKLAAFKVPRRIEFVDRIPRTSTGKAQRSLLAERFRNLSPSLLGKTTSNAD